jgi:hypothetical protein
MTPEQRKLAQVVLERAVRGDQATKRPNLKAINDGPKPIRLIPFNELKLSTARRYLVKGLIPRNGITVVWGPPKCGKSFWLFDCLMHVALGSEYRGRRVHQGPVVYCAFEGQGGISARVEAFRQNKMDFHDGDVPFFLQPVTLDLVKDHEALIRAIRDALGDQTPVVVALDTLNRSLVGSESSDEDMAAYIKAADAISKAFECAVAIVHHCGHNDARMRGHSSLVAALDAELSVKRQADNSIVVKVERLKDGQEGDEIVSKLESVAVGTDEDGDEISSCIVVPAGEGSYRRSTWPKGLKVVHDAISEALLQAGIDHIVGGDGPTVKAVPVKLAKEIHNRRYVSAGDGDRFEAERKAWRRNFKQARDNNLIGAEHISGEELIWLIR